MRLPRSVRLPFGYVVLVKIVSDAEMKDAADCDGGDDTPDGCWDVDTRTIFICRAAPLKRQKYVLGHELGHALWDWQHHCLQEEAMRP